MRGTRQNARAEAAVILRDVWSTISPNRVVPVDPVQIADALGIDVFEAQLAKNVSGAIVKDPGRDPQIIMNRDDHPNRQRFTCAHELGHFVLRSADEEEADEYEFIDFRGPEASGGTDESEIFANAFAAHLLMPEDEVRARVKDGGTPASLAFEFRVSQEAMTHHLKNLGLTVA